MTPVADAVVMQVDVVGVLTIIGSVVAGLTTAAVAAARIVVAYMRAKDLAQQKADELRDEQIAKMGTAIVQMGNAVQQSGEKAKAAIEEVASGWRAEHRETVNNLVTLTREAVQAMAVVNTKVGEVGAGMVDLRGEVRHLGDSVTDLGQSISQMGQNVGQLGQNVGHLTERVDRLDKSAPPPRRAPGNKDAGV